MSPPKMIKWQDPSEIIEDWENWLSERIHTPPEPSSQASAVDIDPDFKTFVHLSELDEEKCTKVTDSLLLHIDSATHQDDWVSWFHLACLQAFLAKRADPTATLGAQYLFSILNELWGSHGRKALLFLKFLEEKAWRTKIEGSTEEALHITGNNLILNVVQSTLTSLAPMASSEMAMTVAFPPLWIGLTLRMPYPEVCQVLGLRNFSHIVFSVGRGLSETYSTVNFRFAMDWFSVNDSISVVDGEDNTNLSKFAKDKETIIFARAFSYHDHRLGFLDEV